MSDPVLNKIAEDIKRSKEEMKTAQKYIVALKEAGEEYAEYQTKYNQLEMRIARWEIMLKNRGVKI